MNEFYVERRSNEKDEHLVHKGNCPSLPSEEKLQYIGVRGGNEAPLQEAAYFWYSSSAPCPVCMGS
ncbi:hypothetical protein GRF61_00660 [Azoarcus sp. TTM-91]|uniref:Uncharacterized protein n=1 Tax=Azoarcus indigens TaxID=29545 RepID=A0A4R6DPB0_9RHOO|nr:MULTISPECIES: hypothetical protein [Azoarcus]NMG32960.1 hypothetical protein [Azoarcus sp. TTM-91]NMG68073.1 hypothetical protein [Azoarcus indigens]TDN46845.1 hypothetical protein C7389_1244 [Azoarcus indigens]